MPTKSFSPTCNIPDSQSQVSSNNLACGIPYSSKFSWHNIFVNFVIDPLFTNFSFTKI